DYIANEKYELEKEKENRQKDADRLAGRFGLDLLGPGASEAEILAYATMLSEEAHASDEQKRRSESESSVSAWSSETVTPEAQTSPPIVKDQEQLDADIAEAIRLSLYLEQNGGAPTAGKRAYEVPFRYGKSRITPSQSPPSAGGGVGSSRVVEEDDLDFALQLSLAEEQSRKEGGKEEEEEFPMLAKSASGSDSGKGKGKRRAS
ncbi:MAG: hypothetical protein M1830_009143, partial [Pleopsidium flavum]